MANVKIVERQMARYSFYVPHKKVVFDGLLLNEATGVFERPEERTKQSFVAECDINNILKQYKLTGQIRHISAKAAQGAYEDLPDPIDFQESMNLVIQAEQSFATLPAHVRSRFGNDPQEFLTFMADPSNQDEAIKLGLATDNRTPPAEPSSSPAPTLPPTPQTPPTGEKTGS